jgi:hypothetical protein
MKQCCEGSLFDGRKEQTRREGFFFLDRQGKWVLSGCVDKKTGQFNETLHSPSGVRLSGDERNKLSVYIKEMVWFGWAKRGK